MNLSCGAAPIGSNFREHDETEIKSSITVHIPEQNLFNVDNLRMLMEQSRKGSIQ